MIGDAIADNMDDLPLLLKPPPHRDHRSRHDLTPVEFEPVGPEDTVGDSGLVFDRYEQDALRGARTLAHKEARKSVGSGKSVSVRVDLGGRSNHQQKNNKTYHI